MRKRHLITVLLLLVFALAGPFIATYQKAQEEYPTGELMVTSICAGTVVPAGWVVVDKTAESFRCGVVGQPVPPVYNVWYIEDVTQSPNGTQVAVCRPQPNNNTLPTGWVIRNTYYQFFKCGVGVDPNQNHNMQIIERVSGGPTPTVTPTPNATPRGTFEFLNDGTATGWTFDPNAPSANVTLHFYLDGPAGSGTFLNPQPQTYIPRPDVNQQFGIAGNHGFAFHVPRQYYDGQNHTLYAYAINIPAGGVNPQLIGSPKTFNLKAGSPMGKFESVGADRVLRGWSLDPSSPSASNTVQFYIDGMAGQGTLIGSTVANIPRPDVNASTGMPGNHGFEFAIPSQYQDGLNHTIYAYGMDLNNDPYVLLQDSPKIFNFPPIVNISRTAYDFNGDGKADQAVYRNGVWHELISPSGTYSAATFGIATDSLVPGDYDGDGKTDLAVFRNNNGTGVWWILQSSNNQAISVAYGLGSNTPVPADYDGDRKTDIAVYHNNNGNSEWWIRKSTNNQTVVGTFGFSTDMPVPADYDGDGLADLAVTRISNGDLLWFIQRTTAGYYGIQFGLGTDVPVPADYDGDGKADIAAFRSGYWYIQQSRDGFKGVLFGMTGDVPVPSDFDGDSKTDIAIFRNNNGNGDWWIQRSSNGQVGTLTFGYGTDIPVNGQ